MSDFFRLIGIISALGAPKMRLKMTINFYDLGTGRRNALSHDLQNLSIDVAVIAFPEDSVLAPSLLREGGLSQGFIRAPLLVRDFTRPGLSAQPG